MKSRIIVFAIAVLTVWSSTSLVWAQGTSSSAPSSSSAGAGSPGTATIENQMIAYEVLERMATEIATKAKLSCRKTACQGVLFADPNAQSEIVTAKAFDDSVKALIKEYQALPRRESQSTTPNPPSLAPISLTDIANLATALKSTAVYTNQNFQPTTQSMITLLSRALQPLPLRSSMLPGDLAQGAKDVQDSLNDISTAQAAVKNPKDREDVDKEFSAFRTSLTAASPDGTILSTIIKGKALLRALGDPNYDILTLSIDGAGGDTKVTHLFWRELFWPTPAPSYNGGAVVSFLLTDQGGNFQDAGQLRFVYHFFKNKKVIEIFNSKFAAEDTGRPTASSSHNPSSGAQSVK